MTRQKLTSALWGLLIILLGVTVLAYNFGALDDYKQITAYAVAGILAIMGLAFLLALAFQREQWFYVIPGFSFLALGGIVYLTTLEDIDPAWLGALFLAGIALGFLVVFVQNRRERWWALLQAETILLIALLGLGMGVPESATTWLGGLLFGGFAASFFFVWLLSGNRARLLWALILSGVLAIFAAVILTSGQSQMVLLLWPGLLLLIGFFLIARVFTGRKSLSSAVDIDAVQPLAPADDDMAEPARVIIPPAHAEEPEIIEPEVIDPPEETP
jgi:hypothetical protein